MTRRDILKTTVGAAAAVGTASIASAAPRRLKYVGLAPAGISSRSRAIQQATGQFDIVEYCNQKGLGAADMSSRSYNTPEALAKLRDQLNKYDMRITMVVQTPRSDDDLPQYDAMIKALSEMDGRVSCTIDKFSGRRYEQFKTAAEYHPFFKMCKEAVQRAEPVLRKYKMRLAIENHKGWRSAELVDWIKAAGSEFIGVSHDMCNNVSLVESPEQTLEMLAPYTFVVSFKDIAVDFYDEGLLLSEVPLGTGHHDLPAAVAMFQKVDPEMLFQLEMITRDPLIVPIFTDQYWNIWDDQSPVPSRDFARLIKWMRDHPPKQPLPKVSGLTPEQETELEDRYNDECLEYCRAHLPTL